MPVKKMLVITSRDAEYTRNSPLADFDFHEPYIQTIFGSFGIENIEFIYANNLEFGDVLNRRRFPGKIGTLAETK
jgi:FMN-dependent NADH-azoreductase